jgi:hypothetical protein
MPITIMLDTPQRSSAAGRAVVGVKTPPQRLHETKYVPELSITREYRWKQDGKVEFLSSSNVAEQCILRFFDLASAYARGEIED